MKKAERQYSLPSFAVPIVFCLPVADGLPASPVKDTFWAEMNRREKWDRDFEGRWRDASKSTYRQRTSKDTPNQDIADLKKEKADEEAVRIEWDINNGKTLEALESLRI